MFVPYRRSAEFWEGPRPPRDWRVEFALFLAQAGIFVTVVAIAAVIVVVPDSTLRSWFSRTPRVGSGSRIHSKSLAPAPAVVGKQQDTVRLATSQTH